MGLDHSMNPTTRRHGYSRRWHATTITSLFSILTSGFVGSTTGAGMATESHTGMAGAVYTHRSAEWKRALYYACYRPVFDDGHLWGVLLEVACDEAYRVGLDTKTTQRAYHPGGCKVKSIYFALGPQRREGK